MDIQKIFVINLKDKEHRFRKFEEIGDNRIERFEAIDSRENRKIYENFSLRLNPVGLVSQFYFSEAFGAIGCYLSHYLIWKKMIQENIEWALVLEDDALTTDVQKLLVSNFVLQKGLDLVQFNKRTPVEFTHASSYFNGTESYALNISGAKKLLKLTHDRDIFQDIIYAAPFKEWGGLKPIYFDMYKKEPRQDWTVKNSITAAVDKFIGYCSDRRLPFADRLKIDISPRVSLYCNEKLSDVESFDRKPFWQSNEEELLELSSDANFKWWE